MCMCMCLTNGGKEGGSEAVAVLAAVLDDLSSGLVQQKSNVRPIYKIPFLDPHFEPLQSDMDPYRSLCYDTF